MTFFLKDGSTLMTWDSLISELHCTASYHLYCESNEVYTVLKQLIVSMILGEEVILVDASLKSHEREGILLHHQTQGESRAIDPKLFAAITDRETLVEQLLQTNSSWRVTLFTSGTTGKPKRVVHNFQSMIRHIKRSDHRVNDIWGLAYAPTQMAGLQVALQGILNGNSIVRLFGLTTEQIYREIRDSRLTHISATPTFYRLLLPCDHTFESVKRVTSGGEAFRAQTMRSLQKVFPRAKVTNVYASTEAGALLASENGVFSISPKNKELIKIEQGELLIHYTLLGQLEVASEIWYHTGDLVETIPNSPASFRFVGRKSSMINVGGHKVNLLEIEALILMLPQVLNARVYAKPNSVLGHVICCDLVADREELNEREVRLFLQSKIQEFKIPRLFRIVDEIPMTATGKVKRKV